MEDHAHLSPATTMHARICMGPPFFFDFGVVTHKGASNKLVNLSRDSGQSRTGGLGTGDWDWGLSTLSTSVRAVPEEGPPGVELKGAEQPPSPPNLARSPSPLSAPTTPASAN